jgi:Sec-independent protein translocase protein TatA
MKKPDYADFNERFQKILQCDEKPIRDQRLQPLYSEVYRFRCRLDMHDLLVVKCLQLEEKIREAIEDAGGCWPGFQKQVKSFYKAIDEALKRDAPEKQDEALKNIIVNAENCIGNDPCTKEQLQRVINTAGHFRAKIALPDQTGSGTAEPGEVATIPQEVAELATRIWEPTNFNEAKPLRDWLETHVRGLKARIAKLRELNPNIRKIDVANILNKLPQNINNNWE